MVEILGADPNGLAEIDGDGVADDAAALAGLGITDEERLALASRYQPGDTLWRVVLTFFSRFDCNWPGGAPADAIPPNGGLPSGGLGRARLDDPDLSADGDIDFQNQALRKSVAIAGTPFTLRYESDRQLDKTTSSRSPSH